MGAFSVRSHPKTEKWREEYIAVGFVNTAVNCFNSTEGPWGFCLRGYRAEIWNGERWVEKELGHNICSPNQKMEQEARGLVEALGSSHDLCRSCTTSGKAIRVP